MSEVVSRGLRPPVRAARNQSVELLRIVSCLGIVAFHARAPGWEICYSGLTVFLILTAYFAATDAAPASLAALAQKLLVPWALATLAFGALSALRHKPVVEPSNPLLGLLNGTSPHLWYLPFAFVGLAVIGALKAHRRGLLYGSAGVAALMLLSCASWRRFHTIDPLGQYLLALAPLCIGVMLALIETVEAKVLGLVVGACLIFAVAARLQGVSAPYVVGTAAVMGALLAPIPWNVRPISRHMFGVYLIHPAVLSASHALHLVGWGASIAAFAASLVVVAGACQVRRTLSVSRAMAGLAIAS